MADCSGRRQVAQAVFFLVCLLIPLTLVSVGSAQTLDEILKNHIPKLREVERYQLNIAQKYFVEKNWMVAMAEYEKYLTLYERSVVAPYVQIKWSMCQRNLRKQNTAIKEGFQSVIDYWPESPEAVWAEYYIGATYKQIGRHALAKKAYQRLLARHAKHIASTQGMWDLVEVADIQKNQKASLSLLKKLTFQAERSRPVVGICQQASRRLASYYFQAGAFLKGVEALATTYDESFGLALQVVSHVNRPIQRMTASDEQRAKGIRLADQAIAYLEQQLPDDLEDPKLKVQSRQLWLSIIGLHNAARRHAQVVTSYQQVLKQFGTDDELLGHFAAWYKSQGKYDEARTIYRRFENKITGLSQVASSYRQQRQIDPALAIYRQLAGQDAEHLVQWKGQEAATYREVAKYPEAIAVYTELLKLDVAHAPAWLWAIGTARQDAGQFQEAIGAYRQCDERFPENYKRMATCHRNLKQPKEALVLYNQVLGGHPASAPWAQLQIGYTFEEMSSKELAIKAFQAVCKKFPKDGLASVAHAQLQNKYKISVTLGSAKDT